MEAQEAQLAAADPTFAGKVAREYETVKAKHSARATSFTLDLA